MKKLILATVLGMALSSSAFARNYGAGGCGMGSVMHDAKGGQISASTTNGTSMGSQTFGITSGTSNCVDDGVVKESKEVSMFIETNRISLANDIARGNGTTLASLTSMLGCKTPDQLANALQSNYKTIFPAQAADSETVKDSILDLANTNC